MPQAGNPAAGDGRGGAREMVRGLLAAPAASLEAILAESDDAGIAVRRPLAPAPARRQPAPGACEVVILGSPGCRHGMLAGGAGGRLVRTATATVLIGPGPAAAGCLLALARHGLFSWEGLDAVCVTCLRPGRCAGAVPCLEDMAARAGSRRQVLLDPAAAARFTAFSPCRFGGMPGVVALARPRGGGGEPAARVGGLAIRAATPSAWKSGAGHGPRSASRARPRPGASGTPPAPASRRACSTTSRPSRPRPPRPPAVPAPAAWRPATSLLSPPPCAPAAS